MNKNRKITLLLTGIASAGVVLTAVLSAKATPKAIEKIKTDSKEKHGDEDAYSFPEAVKSSWKLYIPASISGITTIICIFGIDVCNKHQREALLSVCGLVANVHHDYIEKVKELYGEEVHNHIMEEVARDHCNPPYLSAESLCTCTSLNFDDKQEPKHLFYEPISDRYFESTYSSVIQAEYHLNRNFALGDYVPFNMLLTFLGLDPIYENEEDELGWSIYDEIRWIDFDHRKVTLETGEECYIIETPWMPVVHDEEEK